MRFFFFVRGSDFALALDYVALRNEACVSITDP